MANNSQQSTAFQGQKPWDQTTGAKVLAVLLVIVVGIVGFSSSADEDDATKSVTGFFQVLNDPKATYRDFSDVLTNSLTSEQRQAITNSPGGTYTLHSVGPISDDRRVTVSFSHAGHDFTVRMPVRKAGGSWKVSDPFPRVTFTSEYDNIRFRLTTNESTVALRTGREYVVYPGVHTIRPMGTSSQSPALWEPTTPIFTAEPGREKKVTINPQITASTSQRAIELLGERLERCLATDEFRPSSCPNRIPRPVQADRLSTVSWSLSPTTAAQQATFVKGSSLTQPCYEVTGTLSYTFTTTAGAPMTETINNWKATGCVEPTSGVVAWQ